LTDDGTLMIVLRLIHIICGVFWAGTAMAVAWFILPASRAMGQPGGAFMQQLMFRQKLRVYVGVAMGLTVLSGITMYVHLSMETNGAWAASRMGMVLGVGAVAGIIAGAIGGIAVGRYGQRLFNLGTQVQASGGPPTDEQRREIESLQGKMFTAFRIIAVLLLIAIAAMASARDL
jgi:hypothetical protein